MPDPSKIPLLTACLYWSGVILNALIIKWRTGKSPSLRPKQKLDRLLFLAWLAAIVLWAASPWLYQPPGLFFSSRFASILGAVFILLGFLGTWWCYLAMGNAWAISVNEGRTNRLITNGPFGLARHPIYALQWLIILGNFLLFPALPLAAALVILGFAMHWKAKFEEQTLLKIFGAEYEAYCRKTGRFLPFPGR